MIRLKLKKNPLRLLISLMVFVLVLIVGFGFQLSNAQVAPELYVDGEKIWVDYGDYAHGPIDAPYLTIGEAIDYLEAEGLSQGTIYVAEGTYNENVNLDNFSNVHLLGGYNNTFTSQDTQGNQTRIEGVVNGTNLGGKISGLTFYGGSETRGVYVSNMVSVRNVEVSDNYVGFITFTGSALKIKSGAGGTATIKDNFVRSVFADEAIIDTEGSDGVVVEDNFIYVSKSNSTSYGIIHATDGAIVKNNLIASAFSGNTIGIRITSSGEVYNNTLVDNEVMSSQAAIGSSGTGHKVYNNLVYNTFGGKGFLLSPSADARTNATINEDSTSSGVEAEAINRCEPDFPSSRTDNANHYKLGAASDCIDVGTTASAVTTDYFGTSRSEGPGYDIGFYEKVHTPVCGDGYLAGSEECDDGNTTAGDGCNATCQEETPTAVCGNSTVEAGEQCDDGNTTNGDGCDSSCQDETPGAVCGNSTIESGEECDDGNTTNGDGCSSSCQDEIPGAICGNNTLESGEECDDGNTTDGDGCSATCENEAVACGNWYDTDSSDRHHDEAVYLCEHGYIIRGDSYGNLRLDDNLTRAELLAIAFRASDYKNIYTVDSNADSCFNDVDEEWFAQYFCTAKTLGFVEGYSGNVALPGNNVILAEGLKMYLGALDIPYTINSDPHQWYFDLVQDAADNGWLPYVFTSVTAVGPIEMERRYAIDMMYKILIDM